MNIGVYFSGMVFCCIFEKRKIDIVAGRHFVDYSREYYQAVFHLSDY